MEPLAERVSAVRAFNRLYTRTIGVLGKDYADTPYSLNEARVLFELAHAGGPRELPWLRERVGMDAGYLSRLLAGLEAKGLIGRERSPSDARRQVVRLTNAGGEAFRLLDGHVSEQIGGLLGRLGESDQRRLVGAMRVITSLLDEPTGERIVLRPPRPGDLGWVVHRHGALYAEEHGLNAEFEALVASSAADVLAETAGPGAAWIAELDGERAGSIACTPSGDDPGTAKLRLLLVEPAARGHGLGHRLVEECVEHARGRGFTGIELWTIDVLAAARRIYQQAGFRLLEEKPERLFGRDVVGQTWRLDL